VICPVLFTNDLSAFEEGGGHWECGIYPAVHPAEMERMMKLQDVLLKATAKKITWWDAAEIIGVTDRTMRRWRERLEEGDIPDCEIAGRGNPAQSGSPWRRWKRYLQLYGQKYYDLNIRQ
jgi:hypothetical protein